MRVAILSSGIPSKKYPLNGVFAFDQAKALATSGMDIIFFSVDLRSIRRLRKWGYSSGIRDGVRWHNYSIPIGPFPKLLSVVGKCLIKQLYKRAFDNNMEPDICHAHFTGMGYLANELKKEYGVPYIITEHSSKMNKKVIPDTLLNTATIGYVNAEKVITVSSLLAVSIREKTGVCCEVIPNIIDTSIFKLKENIPHAGFRIVTTALLSERKRIHLLLQAVHEVYDKCPEITIDIIGDGAEMDRLKKYAKESFDENIVVFHGLMSRQDAGKIYEKCDCFVLPSSLETFGVVYVEAMAAGLPVIATRCGGPEDFVDESNGILVDVDNLEQLKDAIIYMYNHYKEYNAKSIKDYVTAKYSPGVVAKKIISVYEEVLNK